MKFATSVRLSDEAMQLWKLLSKKLGISLTSILEMAIRKLAETEGVGGAPVGAGAPNAGEGNPARI